MIYGGNRLGLGGIDGDLTVRDGVGGRWRLACIWNCRSHRRCFNRRDGTVIIGRAIRQTRIDVDSCGGCLEIWV